MTACRSLVLEPVNGRLTRLAPSRRRPALTPVQTWSSHLRSALPGLHERISMKVARRILRYGPLVIFGSKRTMNSALPGLGTVEYACEMRRVLRSAQSCSGIASSVSCYKFFERMRQAYADMYGRPGALMV